MDTRARTRWHVIIPVKDTRVGKSRLTQLEPVERQRLSLAIAQDTIGAAVAAVGAHRVVLVTSDPVLGASWVDLLSLVVPDPGGGLNAAAIAGRLATSRIGDDAAPAVLLGDVPAVRPEELRSALQAAEDHGAAFVPDAEGTGTVLLCGATQPRFGPGSADAHAALGAARLELALPGLRRDVDDDPSLRAAHSLGVGPATSAVLERLWQHGATGRQ